MGKKAQKWIHKYLGSKVNSQIFAKSKKLQKALQMPPNQRPNQNSIDVDDWLDFGEWASVKSSNVHSIQWWQETKSLFVTFRSGSTYVYSPMSRGIARAMFLTASKGKFVWRSLRGKFPFARIS